MAVTDWTKGGKIANGKTDAHRIDPGMSKRLKSARFTVLIDEDFRLEDEGLPIRVGRRQIERATEVMHRTNPNQPVQVSNARRDPGLPNKIENIYRNGGYLHVFIEP